MYSVVVSSRKISFCENSGYEILAPSFFICEERVVGGLGIFSTLNQVVHSQF